MARYLAKHKDTVKYAFLLDPSYRDNRDYGASIRSWIVGAPDRRLLAIFGTASTTPIVDEWIGALRGSSEEIRKHQIVVWHTREGHFDMKKHIRAMENPSYRPPGGTWDKDFAEPFS